MPGFAAAISEMPVAEWAGAISSRHSVRTFTDHPVERRALAALRGFCEALPAREVARIVVLDEVPSSLFTGVLIGSYGRVIGAQSAFLVVGDLRNPVVQVSMGYLGEAVVLQAVSTGLGTCWIAGSFKRGVAAGLAELDSNERVFAISPLGYPKQRPRRGERLLKAAVGAHRRRPINEIGPGLEAGDWPDWAAEGVRLARIAPSAANRQPWKFDLRGDSVTVSVVEKGVEGSISRLLDIGIAMLHFEVGARLMGAAGRWELLDKPAVARYRLLPNREGPAAAE